MLLKSLTVGPFQENTYLVGDPESGEAILVDPGDEWRRIADLVEESRLRLNAIWLTHAHLDHIGAIAGLKRKWDVPVYLHESDLPLYRNADRQAMFYGLPFDSPPLPEKTVSDGEVMRVGAHEFRVMHTPGHAPGHVVFIGEECVLAGDLVFLDSIGRTDLPLSNPAHMTASLEKFARLNPSLELHPGHGPSTTVERELQYNPFLNGMARVVRG